MIACAVAFAGYGAAQESTSRQEDTTASQSSAPAIPDEPEVAAGFVEYNETKISLSHAYASGPIEWGGELYQIVLTDAPLPDGAIDKELSSRGGQELLRAGKVSGIAFLVDAEGYIRNVVPFIGPELRGSRMLASAGSLQSFAVSDRGISGQAEKETNQGWSYAASWRATLRAPAE